MHIYPIHNFGYDAQGHMLANKRPLPVKGNRRKKPIDAVTFDAVEFSGQENESYSWLATYIKNLPDALIEERLKNYRDSFESLEDCLVDKMIVEEI